MSRFSNLSRADSDTVVFGALEFLTTNSSQQVLDVQEVSLGR